ncbi:MAG TPA: uracil phosphoribosyltransferase [Candidatus Eisenbacteria bacterium]|nr:uracil phosphoribosyltransferase [Candidatus Eisenbacteria bacterium]
MNNVFIFDHPLIQHKITLMRDKQTTTKEFRELVREVARLMAYEVTRDLPLKEIQVETPMGTAYSNIIAGKSLALIPILRAGLGMVDGMLDLIPKAKVGHIGLYRDPDTLEAVEYFCKLPADIEKREVILLDPMLATGVSAIDAVNQLKKRNISSIKFMCIIAAPEGIENLHEKHPDIPIFCGAKDKGLDANAYIVPGLGDAGDRLFGTK